MNNKNKCNVILNQFNILHKRLEHIWGNRINI